MGIWLCHKIGGAHFEKVGRHSLSSNLNESKCLSHVGHMVNNSDSSSDGLVWTESLGCGKLVLASWETVAVSL